MFERFTKAARGIVDEAVRQAEQAADVEVRPAHMLAAIVAMPESRAATMLHAHGLTVQEVAAAIAEAERRGGLSDEEVELLNGMGIDVAQVVDRVESVHGAGALQKRWGKPKSPRFSQAAKAVLHRSLREAIDLRNNYIGTEHLLLALAAEPGLAREILFEHGVTYQVLRAANARAS